MKMVCGRVEWDVKISLLRHQSPEAVRRHEIVIVANLVMFRKMRSYRREESKPFVHEGSNMPT